ncbi:MAG: sigma-70 family RNA polymerase sigma factor [Acidobacteriota bacterium]
MSHDEPSRREITDLLRAWGRGEGQALEQMMPLVYDRLHQLASGFLGVERRDHTLQSAALVNEVYLRLVDLDGISWNDRAHFFALCARFMRRILVDHARRSGSAKRGQAVIQLSLDDLHAVPESRRSSDLVDLDGALNELAEKDPEAARIVELRYFGGLNRDEIAEVTRLSSATVTRRWRMARAWLFQRLKVDGHRAPGPEEEAPGPEEEARDG